MKCQFREKRENMAMKIKSQRKTQVSKQQQK